MCMYAGVHACVQGVARVHGRMHCACAYHAYLRAYVCMCICTYLHGRRGTEEWDGVSA